MCAAVVVRDLVTRPVGRVALRRASFSVERGELFGIIGPADSGKTVALECAQGLHTPESGSVLVEGVDPAADPDAVRRLVGTQLEASSLPDRMRVWEIVELFASMHEGPVDQGWVLERWGLLDRRNLSFEALSPAERLRLYVALAVLHDPKIVFFDEITSGLDAETRAVAWGLLEELRDSGFTVVATTAHMDEAERCDRVAVLAAGTVVAIDTPNTLIRRHAGGVRFCFVRPWVETDWIQIVPGVGTYVDNGAMVEVRGSVDSLSRVCAGLVGRGAVPE
ncbi:MAG TPA: ABC transporter ATP-binding protein, partial [Acidimicrobiia bacterium]|nr:ABC transporter ATP-binding protein [Acidimicrobiia bacterium]